VAKHAGLRTAVRKFSLVNPISLIEVKRPPVFPVAALFVLLLFSGCAGVGGASWKQERVGVLDSLQKSEAEQSAMRATMNQMEERIAELEKSLEKEQREKSELSAKLDAMYESNPSRGKITSRVSGSDNKKLARQLEKIGSNIRSAAKKVSPSAMATNPESEKNAYTSAYLALKSGRYDEASYAFKLLLLKHPQGEYADQANFWLGESYFAQQNMKEAIKAFKNVANNYPDSAKHPAALLKLATAYQESNRKGDAKAVLQRLINQHPESNAAEQARTRLKALETEQ